MPAASPQLKNHRHPQNITFIFSRCKSLESALDRVVSRYEKNPSIQNST